MSPYRFFAAAAAFSLVTVQTAFAAQPVPAVIVTAQQIALHADRALLIAEGGVSIRIGTAAPMNATRAAYDLRRNRLVAAGDAAGSGFTYDFATQRALKAGPVEVPQLGTFDALAVGQQVELRPGRSITFSNAQVLAGSTFVPSAAYTYDIPPPRAKDFGYSPVPAAALEYALPLGASKNSYAFTRARYDRYNGGIGAGLEEHYAASDRGYAALGETLDVNGGRWDLATYQHLNDALSHSFTGSYLSGAHTMRYALTSTGPRGYASFSIFQYNNYRQDDLLASGNQHALGRAASFRVQADFAHDVHPGDWHGAQDFRFTPAVHLDTAALHAGAASLSASGDVGEALYDYGRATLASDATLWANVPVTPRLAFSGGATFSHNAPPFPATFRTYTLGSTWRASDAFNLVSSIGYTHDYGQVFGTGRPQWSAAFDVRFRRRNHTGVEIGAVVPFGGVGNLNRQGVLNVRFFKW
ncbi:MAG: hypothetical protein ABR508_06995 [Candidatus Baltobacteraceae bacterium]